MCIGDLPPFDHPHVYIDMGDDHEIVCPYCSTLFVHDPHLEGECDPPECTFHPERVPEPAAPAHDISVATPFFDQSAAALHLRAGVGIVASFETEEALSRALERLQAVADTDTQTYTPKELDGASTKSSVPLAMLAAGLLGAGGGFAMEALANVYAYPLNVGGRPKFSWPSFVPIAFEIGVLFAMLVGFFGYLIAARLPRLYDSIDECESLRQVTRDEWVVAVRASDPQTLERIRKVLHALHPKLVEEISACGLGSSF